MVETSTNRQGYKGGFRDLTETFRRYKHREQQGFQPQASSISQKARFQLGKSSLLSDGLTSCDTSPMNTLGETNDKNTLLPSAAYTKASTSEDGSDPGSDIGRDSRLSHATMLPPEYVDIQDEIDNTLSDISSKMAELKQLQAKRIKDSFFEEDERLQVRIGALSAEVTLLIKKGDGKIKQLGQICIQEDVDTSSTDFQICKNMQMVFAERLKNLTFEMRRREKEHYAKVQELHGGDSVQFKDDLEMGAENADPDGMQQATDMVVADYQSQEIENLVKTINELAVLFKDLSNLVVEQGTILDRVDFNIQHAKESTKKANKSLEKTVKAEKSTRARSVRIFLVCAILVCLIIIVLRFK